MQSSWRKTVSVLALTIGGVLIAGPVSAFADEEWEENSPYYEDDAWYDITEWFDGNDYNPTDEKAFRWDDEVYDVEEDTGADRDSDYTSDYSSYDSDLYDYDPYEYDPYDYYDYDLYDNDRYGYDGLSTADDWFYDYYDDGYSYYRDWDDDGFYDYSYRYYDYNNDGAYDAYSSFHDWDNDGLFEDYDYYTLNTDATNDGQSRSQAESDRNASSSSKRQSISGKITKTKRVTLPNSKHLLVSVDGNNTSISSVDLGPAAKLDELDLEEGDRIKARGPVVKVGDQKLLLAQHVEANGKSQDIKRDRRKFKGEIADTKTVQTRDGQKHTMLILSGNNGKKRLIDLGPKDGLDVQFENGDQVTVQGAPAKLQDRHLVLAESVTINGETTEIDRRGQNENESRTTTAQASTSNRNNDRGKNQRSQSVRREKSVTGEIVDTREATVRGKRRQMARIETDNGDEIVLDLGPAKKIRTQLDKGDQVTARGIAVRANDQRILIARELKRDGETIQIASTRSSQNADAERRRQVRSQRSVTGEVMTTRSVSIRGQKRLLANIETDQGDEVVVDMGPASELNGFRVSKGDELNARGIPVKANDQRVLVAMRLESGDKSVTLKRRSSPSSNSKNGDNRGKGNQASSQK